MIYSSHRQFASFVVVAASFAVPSIAYAQDAAATEAADETIPVTDGEIVVTAQKREQRLSDVPISINTASGEELQDLGVSRTDDLAKIAPGFTAARAAQSGSVIYSLRGLGLNDATLGSLPSVSVYSDEASLPFSFMAQGPLLDLERVEVLKGPQGLLFGQNSSAGAINFIANKPTSEFEAGVRASFGRFDTIEAEAYVSGPVSETLSGRLALSGNRSGPWQKSFTRDDEIGDAKRVAGRLQLQWEPAADLRMLLNLNGWIDKSEPQMLQLAGHVFQSPTTVDPRVLAYPIPSSPNNRVADWSIVPAPPGTEPLGGKDWGSNNRFGQAVLRVDWDIGNDSTLTSLTNIAYARLRMVTDIDGMDVAVQHYLNSGDLRTTDQEVRVTTKLGPVDFIGGASFQYARAKEANFGWVPDQSSVRAFAFLPIVTRNIAYRAHQTHRTWGLFGNGELPLTSTLSASAGARYTRVKHQLLDACITDGGDGGFATTVAFLSGLFRDAIGLVPRPELFVPGGCVTLGPDLLPLAVNDSFKEDNVSWRGSLDWKPNPDTLVYANISRGYKSGSYVNTAGLSYLQYVTPVRQERNTAYEVGTKLSLLRRALQLNIGLFYYDLLDKQILGTVTDLFFGPLPILANIPKSRVYGFDADVTLRPATGLTLRGAVNYSNTRINSHMNLPRYDGLLLDIYGSSFPYAPRWNATGNAQYEWPVGQSLKAFMGASLLYNSATNGLAAAGPATRIKSFATLDLRLGVRDTADRWEVMLWGRNVTDTHYWNSVNFNCDCIGRMTGLPLTYGVTVGGKF